MSEEKPYITELIVVEGTDDLQAVRRAVKAQVMITQGLGLSEQKLEQIRKAQEKVGVIVLTDPDGPGEKIRRWITEAVPGVKHAFLPVSKAKHNGDVGVENASPEDIRQALQEVRSPAGLKERQNHDRRKLWDWGLDGTPGAAQLRERLAEELGLGRVNAKQFLQRVNHFGVTEEEIMEALQRLR